MTEPGSPHPNDPETVAKVYLRHHRTDNDSDFWAFEVATDYAFEDPERAWEVLLELVRHADWEDLGYVGAGILENLCVERGAQFIDRIEAQARGDPKFLAALGNVWLDTTDATPDIIRRLVVASGGKIQPFERENRPS